MFTVSIQEQRAHPTFNNTVNNNSRGAWNKLTLCFCANDHLNLGCMSEFLIIF